MIARLASSALAVAVLCAIVSGCSAPAEPVEPTPLFTSEEQAFEAAEATYRAYVDALNAVDLSDPETFEDVFAWTTGEANANERKTLSQMHADGWTVGGETRVVSVVPPGIADEGISIVACVDVSGVKLLDGGVSVVPNDRPGRYAVRVDLIESDSTPTSLIIEASNAIEDPNCT